MIYFLTFQISTSFFSAKLLSFRYTYKVRIFRLMVFHLKHFSKFSTLITFLLKTLFSKGKMLGFSHVARRKTRIFRQVVFYLNTLSRLSRDFLHKCMKLTRNVVRWILFSICISRLLWLQGNKYDSSQLLQSYIDKIIRTPLYII